MESPVNHKNQHVCAWVRVCACVRLTPVRRAGIQVGIHTGILRQCWSSRSCRGSASSRTRWCPDSRPSAARRRSPSDTDSGNCPACCDTRRRRISDCSGTRSHLDTQTHTGSKVRPVPTALHEDHTKDQETLISRAQHQSQTGRPHTQDDGKTLTHTHTQDDGKSLTSHTHTHRDTQTHTHTHTGWWENTNTHTHTHTQDDGKTLTSHTHTHTQTGWWENTNLTHTHTHTHTEIHTQRYIHTHTHTQVKVSHRRTGSTGSAAGIPVDSCTCSRPPDSDSRADSDDSPHTRPCLSHTY